MEKDGRLSLPEVTICAVSSVNVTANLRALEFCLEQVRFGACKFLTDADVVAPHPEIEVVPIARIASSAAYSDFLLRELVDHVETSHCLVVQWDGYLLDRARWQSEFLNFDYVGASWPQFDDGFDVGNGGFSLRSRRLMELCRHPEFVAHHPEDVAIGRTNRRWLEERGIRIAPRPLADLFSAERRGDPRRTFGFHGVWNMPRVIGADEFWEVYRTLDEVGSVLIDFRSLLRDLGDGPFPLRRRAMFVRDRMAHSLRHVWRKLCAMR